MKKTLADALRALARRLDPPAPLVVRIYGMPSTVDRVMADISWKLGNG